MDGIGWGLTRLPGGLISVGPLMPILEVEDLDQAIRIIRSKPTPLALYVFSASK